MPSCKPEQVVNVQGVHEPTVEVLSSSIPYGAIFTGRIRPYTDRLFASVRNGDAETTAIVSLQSRSLWIGPVTIQDYRLVSGLDITVKY